MSTGSEGVEDPRELEDSPKVDLIVTEYTWHCRNCGLDNKEDMVETEVKCRHCGGSYIVNDHYHAYHY